MRGMETGKTRIRHSVFTEIACLAYDYEGGDYAKALEELLTRQPSCPRAISDQFAKSQDTVRRALQERGRRIVLEQHPKAEADVAVAAASILARAEFVTRMRALGESSLGRELPKGVSAPVLAAARELVAKLGPERLGSFAKLHFRTAAQVLGADTSPGDA